MTAWHRSRRADLGLRASGLFLCGMAYSAFSRLCAMHISPQTAGALAYALALIGFLGASAGSAMAMLGNHLFDEIEVSERWRLRSRAPRPPLDAGPPSLHTVGIRSPEAVDA